MNDIDLSTKNTRIFVSSSSALLYPATDLYPSEDLYPVNRGEEVTNIVAGSMSLEEMIVDNDLIFGQLFASKFEVTLYDVEDMSDKFIVVYQDDNGNLKMIFSGVIDSSKKNKDGYDRQIVAYDRAYYYGNQNVADWWTTFWESRTEATILQIRNSLLDNLGISYDEVSLPNDSIIVAKGASFTTLTFSAALKMVCEINCCFPHFDRSGKLEFIVLDDESTAINISGSYEGDNSTFEDFETEAITGIQFLDSTGAIKRTVGTNDNVYAISQDNVLLYSLDDNQMDTVGNNMLSYISGIQYTPCEVKMIAGDLDYKLGSRINTGITEFYILQNSYSNAQLIEQTMKASGVKHLDTERRALETSATSLNEKYARLTFDLEQFSVELGNFEHDVEFVIVPGQISSAVSTAKTELEEELSTNYTGDYIPTTSNSPASSWATLTEKAKHVNDTFFYNNGTNEESKIYCWKLISGTTYGWVDVTSAYQTKTNSQIQQLSDNITLAVNKQANYNGAVPPTTSNYPASSWTTDALKKEHVGEVYRDSETGKFYIWKNTDGIVVKFNSSSATESASYDYVEIYYYNFDDDNYYKIKNPNSKNSSYPYRFGGNGSNNDIADTEVYIPTGSFYIYWHTDTSIVNYGFEITSIGVGCKPDSFESVSASLPRAVDYTVSSVANILSTVKTDHDYSNSEDCMWCAVTNVVVNSNYNWKEVGDTLAAVQSSMVDIGLDSISLSVSNYGTRSTLTLTAGETTLSSASINITGFVTFSNLSTSGQTTINGDNITTGTITDGTNMTINLSSGAISAKEFSLNSTHLTISNVGNIWSTGSILSGSKYESADISTGVITSWGQTSLMDNGVISNNYYDNTYNSSTGVYTVNNDRYIEITSGQINFYSYRKNNSYMSSIRAAGSADRYLYILTQRLQVRNTSDSGYAGISCANISASSMDIDGDIVMNSGDITNVTDIQGDSSNSLTINAMGKRLNLWGVNSLNVNGDSYNGYTGWFTDTMGSGNGVRTANNHYCDMRWVHGILVEISQWS